MHCRVTKDTISMTHQRQDLAGMSWVFDNFQVFKIPVMDHNLL